MKPFVLFILWIIFLVIAAIIAEFLSKEILYIYGYIIGMISYVFSDRIQCILREK